MLTLRLVAVFQCLTCRVDLVIFIASMIPLLVLREMWQLKQPDVTIKAEALRRAQLAMLRGELRLNNGTLRRSGGANPIPLPAELSGNQDFSHPYYWAAFTIIGSPW